MLTFFCQATWHPLQDLIVVGRYPDKNFPGYQEKELRTIDIIDPENGETVHQIHDPAADGLTCVSNFSRQHFKIFFLLFQKTGFEFSCKLSPMETICMKCQNLFSWKNKKKIS